jgi:CheY-like chemotaxis protein
LDLAAPAEPLWVSADRARLAQVIGNLLSNAFKFSERGQTVRVGVGPDGARPVARLTVRDEGTGIEPALLERIFEPFVQAETPLSRPRGGLGLGLAVVKGLVALHDGRVVATSEGLGRGAELRIDLPLEARPTAVAPADPQERQPAAALAATVLVFEDNVDAAESVRSVLSAAGYLVAIQATGQGAMETVRRVRPHAVLCDIGLPDRDGYEIASDIRADPDWGHLPLIAVSGYGSAQDLARSQRAGFHLHLTKPVAPELLIAELARRTTPASPTSDG